MTPDPRLRTCERTDPAIACRERVAAVRAGTFWWSFVLRTWVWLRESAIPARMSVWQTCPWCARDLPDLGPEPLGADATGYIGEDGG